MENPESLEDVPVGLCGGSRWFLTVVAAGGISERFERCGRGGGRCVRLHPASQRGRSANLVAECVEVAVDNPFEVAGELSSCQARGKVVDPGEPGSQDLVDVVAEV